MEVLEIAYKRLILGGTGKVKASAAVPKTRKTTKSGATPIKKTEIKAKTYTTAESKKNTKSTTTASAVTRKKSKATTDATLSAVEKKSKVVKATAKKKTRDFNKINRVINMMGHASLGTAVAFQSVGHIVDNYRRIKGTLSSDEYWRSKYLNTIRPHIKYNNNRAFNAINFGNSWYF